MESIEGIVAAIGLIIGLVLVSVFVFSFGIVIYGILYGFWGMLHVIDQLGADRKRRKLEAKQALVDPIQVFIEVEPDFDPEREYYMQLLKRWTPLVEAPAVALPIFFKAGEPTSFEDFGLQPSVIDMLDIQIRALPVTHSRMRPQMFLGPAGLGKTLLSKVCAEELRKRNKALDLPEPVFIEVFPADMSSVADLDAVIRRAANAPAAVIFIDEVHGLAGIHAHKLYELLENGRYPFHGDDSPTPLPNVTLLAATTDYGKLHSALKRRWVKHYLESATEQQLVDILHRRGSIAQDAAERIMERTKFGGAPWEAVELFELAKAHALATHRDDPEVQIPDVNWVFEQQEIDKLGLRKFDRNVIEALRERRRNIGGELVHGASESDTCVLAGVDRTEYRETIRPRLMARGLLEIRSGVGQVLTDKALKAYPRNYVPVYV